MMATIGASDVFLNTMMRSASVRKQFPAVRTAHNKLRQQPATCCGGSKGRSNVFEDLREFLLNMNSSDAGQLKKLLGVKLDDKILVSRGFGASRREKKL